MSLQYILSALLYEAVSQGPGEILMLRLSHYYQFSVQVNLRTCELTPRGSFLLPREERAAAVH